MSVNGIMMGIGGDANPFRYLVTNERKVKCGKARKEESSSSVRTTPNPKIRRVPTRSNTRNRLGLIS